MEIAKIIGKNIEAVIKQNAMTIEECAKLIGVTRQTISKYISGESVIDSGKLFTLARYFNKSIQYFMSVNEDTMSFMFRAEDPKNNFSPKDRDFINDKFNKIFNVLSITNLNKVIFIPESYKINVGKWRNEKEAMQVISGPLGRQKVHYEAPPSGDVPAMMEDFLNWLNSSSEMIDPLVKAAVAHLWFVTVHPFDDGNGRICRTITEYLLSRADCSSKRYYSLSSEILKHRNDYYNHLERTQKGDLNITEWIVWFVETLKKAVEVALDKTERVVKKRMFWDKHHDTPLNERQRKVLNMMLDGFEGKLNSSKWYKINHCSQDTATRDINDLINKGVLRKSEGGGRSTNYELV